MPEYEQRMMTLRTVIELWTQHMPIMVVSAADQNDELMNTTETDELESENGHEAAEEPEDATETVEPESENHQDVLEEPDLNNRLQLPQALKQRGRPKGCKTTFIGLSRAKMSNKTRSTFTELSKPEQQPRM